MPFGLNSAPRIFTKLFKPILRLLRSQGMLLIIYLDDILLIAPTADLCLAQGKFLMKLLQDLGFLVNINKSVLTPNPKDNFSGFSDRLCKYDNFSPRGKTISNNSKRQFIVGSKFGLYSKPVSVCGHVFSIKASAFVLQKNSTVIKQSFKQSWSKQETMLQSENSTKFSGSSELAVVGRRNATLLLSSSVFPTSQCENSNQLIFPGLGCNYGACQNSWSLGMGKAVVPHKQERTADLFHCSGIFCFPSKRHSCSAVSGQYCCCKLSESRRGDKVTSFVRSRNCNLGMVFTEKDLSFSNSHTRHVHKTPDSLSRQKLESTEWMLDSSVFCQIVAVYQQPQVDLFASHHNHQLPNYFSWILDPQAMGTDAFSIPWKFNLYYLFPPFPLIQKCIQKIKQDQTDALLITPVWKSRPWYPLLLEMLMDLPALLPLHAKLLHLQCSHLKFTH